MPEHHAEELLPKSWGFAYDGIVKIYDELNDELNYVVINDSWLDVLAQLKKKRNSNALERRLKDIDKS
jgi:hypothetical protein